MCSEMHFHLKQGFCVSLLEFVNRLAPSMIITNIIDVRLSHIVSRHVQATYDRYKIIISRISPKPVAEQRSIYEATNVHTEKNHAAD